MLHVIDHYYANSSRHWNCLTLQGTSTFDELLRISLGQEEKKVEIPRYVLTLVPTGFGMRPFRVLFVCFKAQKGKGSCRIEDVGVLKFHDDGVYQKPKRPFLPIHLLCRSCLAKLDARPRQRTKIDNAEWNSHLVRNERRRNGVGGMAKATQRRRKTKSNPRTGKWTPSDTKQASHPSH